MPDPCGGRTEANTNLAICDISLHQPNRTADMTTLNCVIIQWTHCHIKGFEWEEKVDKHNLHRSNKFRHVTFKSRSHFKVTSQCGRDTKEIHEWCNPASVNECYMSD